MANIRQQKKRIRIAADERLENLRYRSTIKTLTKRLAAAVDEADSEVVQTEHRNLVRWIDRAVTRGALHRNAGARKKSQAARLATSEPAAPVATKTPAKAAPKSGSKTAASKA
jgi:small subunit ribosomal protein S20